MKSDLRQALRALAADPGFAGIVMFTLALAIGVNSTIFSVVNGVLLRPLDYAEPERLVVLWESNPGQGQPRAEVSGATYLDWRAQSRTLESLGAYRYRGFTLAEGEDVELVSSFRRRSSTCWAGGPNWAASSRPLKSNRGGPASSSSVTAPGCVATASRRMFSARPCVSTASPTKSSA